MSDIKEPMNPFATEDFANAIKEATENVSKELGKIGKQMKADFPFVTYDDMYPEYGGRMRLVYADGRGAWHDVMSVLIAHGYEVTLHTENATETEKELDHIDKWIIIEFDEER